MLFYFDYWDCHSGWWSVRIAGGYSYGTAEPLIDIESHFGPLTYVMNLAWAVG